MITCYYILNCERCGKTVKSFFPDGKNGQLENDFEGFYAIEWNKISHVCSRKCLAEFVEAENVNTFKVIRL